MNTGAKSLSQSQYWVLPGLKSCTVVLGDLIEAECSVGVKRKPRLGRDSGRLFLSVAVLSTGPLAYKQMSLTNKEPRAELL